LTEVKHRCRKANKTVEFDTFSGYDDLTTRTVAFVQKLDVGTNMYMSANIFYTSKKRKFLNTKLFMTTIRNVMPLDFIYEYANN